VDKITVNLEPEVDRGAVHRVQSVLHDIGPGDELTIIIESADAHQAASVFELLDENGFDYQPKGGHEGNRYYINARRKIH
jgi:hypothetical protein